MACGILVPQPGIEPMSPLHWQLRILTAGPPGKPLPIVLIAQLCDLESGQLMQLFIEAELPWHFYYFLYPLSPFI